MGRYHAAFGFLVAACGGLLERSESVDGGRLPTGGSAPLYAVTGGTGGMATGGSPSVGGAPPACRSCAPDSCGPMDDGCGHTLDCGPCVGGVCGYTTPGKCVPCTPRTCAELGADCGPVADGCGRLLDCGTCSYPNVCGGDHVANRCGRSQCINLCQRRVTCDGGSETTLQGTVYAPNGTLPLPNADVYIPNADWGTYPYGLSSGDSSVCPYVDQLGWFCWDGLGTRSASDGSFTIANVPAGEAIPLVIQLGPWRRLVTLDVPPCTVTTLGPEQTRLPRRQHEGNEMDTIPTIAVATGADDPIECVLRKLGVEDSQFSNAGGGGSIQFYVDNGAVFDDRTPGYRQLTSSLDELRRYNAVLYPCRGTAHTEPAEDQARLLDPWADSPSYPGWAGHVLFSHYSAAWLENMAPFNALPWLSGADTATTVIAEVATSFPRGQTLAEWLALAGVDALWAPVPPRVSLGEAHLQFSNPLGDAGFEPWLATTYEQSPVPATLLWMFNTTRPSGGSGTYRIPTGGRMVFSSFHVPKAEIPGGTAAGAMFPAECDGTFTTEDKLLAYVLFELTRCFPSTVGSDVCQPSCDQRLTCADQGIRCGPAGDGCGGQIDCGPC